MKKFILITAITLMSITSAMTQAAMNIIDPLSSPVTFTAENAGTVTFEYISPVAVTQIAAGDSNPYDPIDNQNYNHIADVIETVFSLPTDTFVAMDDTTSDKYRVDSLGDVSSVDIISTVAYDYLAIHLGKYEIFFQFASLVPAGETFEFTITNVDGPGGGISNYRAYNSAVPIPAAAFLFAPALLGFMGLRRKAKNSVA